MSRSNTLLAIFACWLWCAPASAAYTTAQIASGPDIGADGSVHYIAIFGGTGETSVKIDVFVPASQNVTTGTQNALRDIANKLNNSKSKDTTLPAVNDSFDVTPVGVVVPTVDDIAVSAFQSLVLAWQTAKGKNAISATFGTQAAVDAAAAAIATSYGKGTAPQITRFDIILATIQRVFP